MTIELTPTVYTMYDQGNGTWRTAENQAPTVANSISNQAATENNAYSFQFPSNTFSDPEGGALTYSATLSSGAALPAWLTFTSGTRTFSGTPLTANIGTITVRVTASDGALTVYDDFDIVTTSAGETTYNFNTDTYATVKNGFAWSGSKTIATPAGESDAGGRFRYTGIPNPTGANTNIEQRYSHPAMSEFYFKTKVFYPANYFHRRTLNITITGDISAWQIGDILVGSNGVGDGEIEYIDGQLVSLLFADDTYVTGVSIWTGTITNSTRGGSITSTRTAGLSDNNKLHAFWCDGYSQAGQSPSVVFEMRVDNLGGSRVYFHWSTDGTVTGVAPNSTSAQVDYIRGGQDEGKWFETIYYIKMATSEAAADGIIRMWLKREGEGSYTKILEQTNATIGPRAAATPPNATFMNGYCHGAANTGFSVETAIYDNLIVLSSSAIDGVTP